MKKPIYITYLGRDVEAGKIWSDYRNPDTPKLAMACAMSWRSQGWDPVFVRPSSTWANGFKRFGSYPTEIMNGWQDGARRTESAWSCGFDVFNYAFTPEQAEKIEPKTDGPFSLSLEISTWGGSCMWCNQAFCKLAISLIEDYEAGKFNLPACDVPSDEVILRHKAPVARITMMSTAYCHANWWGYPLVHYARTAIQFFKPYDPPHTTNV